MSGHVILCKMAVIRRRLHDSRMKYVTVGRVKEVTVEKSKIVIIMLVGRVSK